MQRSSDEFSRGLRWLIEGRTGVFRYYISDDLSRRTDITDDAVVKYFPPEWVVNRRLFSEGACKHYFLLLFAASDTVCRGTWLSDGLKDGFWQMFSSPNETCENFFYLKIERFGIFEYLQGRKRKAITIYLHNMALYVCRLLKIPIFLYFWNYYYFFFVSWNDDWILVAYFHEHQHFGLWFIANLERIDNWLIYWRPIGTDRRIPN